MKQTYFLLLVFLFAVMADANGQDSGTTGNLIWTYSDGTLTISGEGNMPDYDRWEGNASPWYRNYSHSITTVIVEEGVTSIGMEAFYECTSLTSVTLPESLTFIGYTAFYCCSRLASIILPDGVKEIESFAFASTGLTSVTLPKELDWIYINAFAACSNLTSIIIDKDNPWYTSEDGILFDKNKTQLVLYPKGKQGEYVIPTSVTSIEESAFSQCINLTSIILPEGLTSIGWGVFSGCTGLTSIILPEGLTEIGFEAFSICTGLTSIVIPEGVTSIANGAFWNCTGLTSITLPESLTLIRWVAFSGCNGLANIYSLNPTPPTCEEYAFLHSNEETCTLHVPAGSKAAYKIAEGWQDFQNIVEIKGNSFADVLANDISVYPNPATDEVRFNLIETAILSIYDMSGRLCLTQLVGVNETVDIAHLPIGTYIYTIAGKTGKINKQ